MNKILTLASLFVLLSQGSAFAAVKKVNCQNPMVGFQTTVFGTLTLQSAPNGAQVAEGKLSVTMGPVTAHPNPAQILRVKGQYDKIQGHEYATLGFVQDFAGEKAGIDMIYVNFNDTSDRAESYLELKGGARHPLNCSASQ